MSFYTNPQVMQQPAVRHFNISALETLMHFSVGGDEEEREETEMRADIVPFLLSRESETEDVSYRLCITYSESLFPKWIA